MRQQWRSHASHVYGQDAIVQAAPAGRFEQAQEQLAWMRDMLDFLGLGEDLPAGDLPDIRALLPAAACPGAWLEGRQLLAVAIIIEQVKHLRQALLRAPPDNRLLAMGQALDLPLTLGTQICHSLDEEGQVRDQAAADLAQIRRHMQQLRGDIQRILHTLLNRAHLADVWQERLITLRSERYVLPLRASHRGRVKGPVHDRSASGETLFIEPLEVLELNNQLVALQLDERQAVIRVLCQLTAAVHMETPTLVALLDTLGRLDALRAGALLAQRYDGQVPSLDRAPRFDLQQLRHPLLCLQKNVQAITPNHVHIGAADRQWIISGPNTGGKTVLIKSVGLAHLMAYLGLPIPAQGHCGWFQQILTVIGDEQSVEHNLSTFSSQLLRLRTVLEQADDNSLVLLDELGSGTDPDEGGALGVAIAETLLQRHSICLISTHLVAIKHYAANRPGVRMASMRFDPERLQPTHQLQIDVSGESHAIDIAQTLCLPEAIISAARQHLQSQQSAVDKLLRERDRILAEAGQARQQAETARQAAAQMQAEAELARTAAQAAQARAYQEAQQAWQDTLGEARQQVKQRIRALKQTRDTSAVMQQLDALDAHIQAQAPQSTASAVASDLPAVGATGLFLPYRLTATVLEVDAKQQRICVDLRGKPVWGRVDQFQAQPGLQMPANTGGVSTHSVASDGLQLDLRGQRHAEAEQNLLRFIDDAQVRNHSQVRILHGTGNGVLAQMVRDTLRHDPRIATLRMARPEQGGGGVTEVTLK